MWKTISIVNLKTSAKLLLYIGLLVTGIVFALDGISEYLDGKTHFRIETQPLTNSDLPTITLCLSCPSDTSCYNSLYWEYNNTVKINSYNNEPLSLGVNYFDQMKVYLTELKPRDCYKISHSAKSNHKPKDISSYKYHKYKLEFLE